MKARGRKAKPEAREYTERRLLPLRLFHVERGST